ncbi:MAG: hypothetical protein AAGI49_08775 [Bacteroidota bacterium]
MKNLSIVLHLFVLSLLIFSCEQIQVGELINGTWKGDLSRFFSSEVPNNLDLKLDEDLAFQFANLKSSRYQLTSLKMDMGVVRSERVTRAGSAAFKTIGAEDVDSMIVVTVPQDSIFKEFIPVYVRSDRNDLEMIKGVFIPEEALGITSEMQDGNGYTIQLSDGTTITIQGTNASHYLMDSYYAEQNFFKTDVE